MADERHPNPALCIHPCTLTDVPNLCYPCLHKEPQSKYLLINCVISKCPGRQCTKWILFKIMLRGKSFNNLCFLDFLHFFLYCILVGHNKYKSNKMRHHTLNINYHIIKRSCSLVFWGEQQQTEEVEFWRWLARFSPRWLWAACAPQLWHFCLLSVQEQELEITTVWMDLHLSTFKQWPRSPEFSLKYVSSFFVTLN